MYWHLHCDCRRKRSEHPDPHAAITAGPRGAHLTTDAGEVTSKAVVGASAAYVTVGGRGLQNAETLRRYSSRRQNWRDVPVTALPSLSVCSRPRDASSSATCSRAPRLHCWRKRTTCDRCGCSPASTPDRCRSRRPGHREQTSLHLPHSRNRSWQSSVPSRGNLISFGLCVTECLSTMEVLRSAQVRDRLKLKVRSGSGTSALRPCCLVQQVLKGLIDHFGVLTWIDGVVDLGLGLQTSERLRRRSCTCLQHETLPRLPILCLGRIGFTAINVVGRFASIVMRLKWLLPSR